LLADGRPREGERILDKTSEHATRADTRHTRARPAGAGRHTASRRTPGSRLRKFPARWLLPSILAAVVLAGGLAAYVVTAEPGSAGEPPTAAPASATPQGPGGSWALTWHDEFKGTSLNRKMWQPDRSGSQNGDAPFEPDSEAAWFSPSNVAVKNGNLTLTLQKGSKELGGKTYPYNSAVVKTTKPFLVKPGSYIEARIKVPACDGCWPAFWLVPEGQWPPEIDIFEFFGTQSDNRPSFNYHPPEGNQTGPDHYGKKATDYTAAFHVYGVQWDGRRAIPYVDGKAYPGSGADKDMTSLPLQIILNLSVQSDHSPDAGRQLRVDWVRVWKRA
jgi:beta-glucanase (GH16 family)